MKNVSATQAKKLLNVAHAFSDEGNRNAFELNKHKRSEGQVFEGMKPAFIYVSQIQEWNFVGNLSDDAGAISSIHTFVKLSIAGLEHRQDDQVLEIIANCAEALRVVSDKALKGGRLEEFSDFEVVALFNAASYSVTY